MEQANAIFFLAAVLCIGLAATVILYIRYKEKATFRIMNDMMDRAINNTFSEATYNETCLSALECKLNRFLTISKSSEQNMSEERAKIKELVSDISHQTKTPVSNILLYAQLLQEQEGLPEQSQRLAGEITAQSEKLSFLIQALLKISRLETGIISVNPEISSVKELIEKSIRVIKEKADGKSLSLHLSCEEDLQACFDAKWTEEAVVNILDNSVKYTPAGGTIAVKTAIYELFTRIDIADNGAGIEKEELNRIFQRFYRSPKVSRYEGVGIGLYLAREIITTEGGYIKVTSEPQKGSVFSVFLPNREERA